MSSLVDTLGQRLAEGRDSPLLRFGLGKGLLDDRNPQRAILHLREAIRQDPFYSAAWAQLGRCELQLGDRAAAIEAWSHGYAVAKARGDEQVKRQIAVWLRRLGCSAEQVHG
jgi:predicted Zn-dependent protease